MAQEKSQLSVKAGMNFSQIWSKSQLDSDSRTGYYAGLALEIPIKGIFALQPEVLYITQGARTEMFTWEGSNFYNYKLNYLQVPLIAKFSIFKDFKIEGGPVAGYLLKEKNTIITAMQPIERPLKANFVSNFEFGGVAGISYNFLGGFYATARYYHALSDLYQRQRSHKAFNHGFQIGTGYIF